jgi:hypothetical protein
MEERRIEYDDYYLVETSEDGERWFGHLEYKEGTPGYNKEQIRQAALSALATVQADLDKITNVEQAAQTIIDFQGTTIDMPTLIMTLKNFAQGFKVICALERTDKAILSGLIRLELDELDTRET